MKRTSPLMLKGVQPQAQDAAGRYEGQNFPNPFN